MLVSAVCSELNIQMSHIMTKPAFGICEQQRRGSSVDEALPGEGGTCSRVPLEKMALFPKNKILIFYVPCSPYF